VYSSMSTAMSDDRIRECWPCSAFLAEARGIVERWIEAHTGALHWLPPEAGAFCCMQLDPGIFGPRDIERFYAHLARERTLVARAPGSATAPTSSGSASATSRRTSPKRASTSSGPHSVRPPR
jgi:DNA-binding transcriptional MocR family regulator